MSYRSGGHFQEQYEESAWDREQQQREQAIRLFVLGNAEQQQGAREWLLDYLSELNLEQYRRRNILERMNITSFSRATKALTRAEMILPLFQTLPRDKAIQTLGMAASAHHCF
jgi:hypothetical protein